MFDPALPYEKHPQVAIRRERFGGLAYHYGNRRLTFLKARELADLVETLGDYPSAAQAVADHAPARQRKSFEKALAGLVTSEVIRARAD
jgi:putative mycofactocin binding protein MftB